MRAGFLAVLLGLSGCFFQVGGGYYPSTTVAVQRTTDPAPIAGRQAAMTFSFSLGLYLELFGAGVHWAWFAARAIRNAGGLPHNLNAHGDRFHVAVDLPVRFGPGKLFGLRGTYAYETYDKVNAGNDGEPPTTLGGSGNGHHLGASIAVPGNDLALNLSVGRFSFASEVADGSTSWPMFEVSGWGADLSLMIRFVPMGSAATYYDRARAERSAPSCPDPQPRRVCKYRPGGYSCLEELSC